MAKQQFRNGPFDRFGFSASSNLLPRNVADRPIRSCVGDSNSGIGNQGPAPSDSDEESSCCGSGKRGFRSLGVGLIKVNEGEKAHGIIKDKLISSSGDFDVRNGVLNIRRIDYSGITKQAQIQSFGIFSKAMEKRRGGDANVKYAWYGASGDEISNIIAYGFSDCQKSDTNRSYGCGIYLSPQNRPIQSIQSSVFDEDGFRHLLLCRVILGKMEQVYPGSGQCYPSSEQFDSGADNLLTPNKYIIWSTYMNTNILPEYVISFKSSPCLKDLGSRRMEVFHRRNIPNSPWIPLPTLISLLSKFLPSYSAKLITKYHHDYKEKKMLKGELTRRLRQIVGNELIRRVIKTWGNKVNRLLKI